MKFLVPVLVPVLGLPLILYLLYHLEGQVTLLLGSFDSEKMSLACKETLATTMMLHAFLGKYVALSS